MDPGIPMKSQSSHSSQEKNPETAGFAALPISGRLIQNFNDLILLFGFGVTPTVLRNDSRLGSGDPYWD